MVDTAPEAKQYCTDGYYGYLDVVFPGKHIFNVHNKKDTFTVESVNADLRHYIPTLARRSRCFPRKLDNLQGSVLNEEKSKNCVQIHFLKLVFFLAFLPLKIGFHNKFSFN